MSGSVHRFPSPSPVRQAYADSLAFAEPPTLPHLKELLSRCAAQAGWTAWEIQPADGARYSPPDEESRQEAETACFLAYLALYAMRGRV